MMSNDMREKIFGLVICGMICLTIIAVVSIMGSSMNS
jgi:hypothetical protein